MYGVVDSIRSRVPRAAALALAAAIGIAAPASAQQTLKLQPEDTYLNIDSTNYSTEQALTAYTWPDRAPANAILLKFDLSAIPANAVVTSATLNMALVASDGTADSSYRMSAHKLLYTMPVIAKATGRTSDGSKRWRTSSCCYHNIPLAQSNIGAAESTVTVDKTQGYKAWPVTSMVQDWLRNPSRNFGMLVNADASVRRDRYRTFASSEHRNAGLRPYLAVTFSGGTTQPPPAPPDDDNTPPPPPPPPPDDNTPPPPATGSLSARYKGDVGIESDPAVVFVEKFDQATVAAIFSNWTDVLHGSGMVSSTDIPPGSPGGRSLEIPSVNGSGGGHLFKQLPPLDGTIYIRYYIKYPAAGTYQHDGVWAGGYNPALSYPNPQAGSKPTGTDRFSASAEQSDDGRRFDHYDYWMDMRRATDGNYWGNTLLNNPSVTLPAGQWACVEQMIKLNDPSTSNGEHAIWLNGVKVSHVGPGFPNGRWSGGNFIQDPSGSPFPGMRWRSTSNLKLNWIWLQNYSPNASNTMKFDHLVVARSYIGCMQ